MPNFIGVNGFLISCATCIAISRHALSRSDWANASQGRCPGRLLRHAVVPLQRRRSPAPRPSNLNGSTGTSGRDTSIRSIITPRRAKGCVMPRVKRKARPTAPETQTPNTAREIADEVLPTVALQLRDASYRKATRATRAFRRSSPGTNTRGSPHFGAHGALPIASAPCAKAINTSASTSVGNPFASGDATERGHKQGAIQAVHRQWQSLYSLNLPRCDRRRRPA